MVTRRERFDDLVLEASERVQAKLGDRRVSARFAVEDVPPEDPFPWEDPSSVLGRVVAADRGRERRIVVYRRPVEARARDDEDLADLVLDVVVDQVAGLIGVPADEIDPR